MSAGNTGVNTLGGLNMTDASHSILDGSSIAAHVYTNMFDAKARLGVLSFPVVGAKLSMHFVSTLLNAESGSAPKSLEFSTGTFDHRASLDGVLYVVHRRAHPHSWQFHSWQLGQIFCGSFAPLCALAADKPTMSGCRMVRTRDVRAA